MNFTPPLATALAQPGRTSVVLSDESLGAERPVTVHAYRGKGYAPDKPVVIVLHGLQRNGPDYRDFWAEAADRHDLLILAPTFSEPQFHGGAGYNLGGVFDAEGRLTQPAAWAFAIPLRLVAALRESGVMTREKARLFGHSAGAQFVHRLLSTFPPYCFEAVCAANAGWYSLPVLEKPYPEGLGGIGLGEGDVLRLLATPLTLLTGEADTSTDSASLNQTETAERQGPNRHSRAQFYLAAGMDAARSRGLSCAWQLVGVPGIGHDGRAMSRACAGLWFTGKLPSLQALKAGGDGKETP